MSFHGSGMSLDVEGLIGFEDVIEEYIAKAGDNETMHLLQIGADALVSDALKLPKPVSRIHAPGYTHLVHTFASQTNNRRKEIEVGWGKYYGPMVEKGTRKMAPHPHLVPLYVQNQEKYANLMRAEFEK